MSVRCHPLVAALALAAGLALTGPASAQGTAPGEAAPAPGVPPSDASVPEASIPDSDPEARLDSLFADLDDPGRPDWQKVQGEIIAIWSRSGSPAMDLLLRRGQEALEAGDSRLALERLDALTDLAPGFAEGWNARATAWFMEGEYALSISDIEHVLALNPRHFGALSGLGSIYEELGEPEQALGAMRAVRALNPNQPGIDEAIRRLEAARGESDI